DRGFRHCHWFIANRVVGHFVDLDSVAQKEVNFKSKLLEWSQKNRVHISFKDFANEGDTKGFESTVNIEGIVVGRGAGRSKKESQQEASKEACLRRDAKLTKPLPCQRGARLWNRRIFRTAQDRRNRGPSAKG
ncbi:MAG: putative dsRNA-binding protein, partial [Prevotellamassilia sp.]